MSNISMTVAWIVVALCVLAALYLTHNSICLWAFAFPFILELSYIATN